MLLLFSLWGRPSKDAGCYYSILNAQHQDGALLHRSKAAPGGRRSSSSRAAPCGSMRLHRFVGLGHQKLQAGVIQFPVRSIKVGHFYIDAKQHQVS
jgi:hypothetical protein